MGRLRRVDRGPAAIGVPHRGRNGTGDGDGPKRQGEYAGPAPEQPRRPHETADGTTPNDDHD